MIKLERKHLKRARLENIRRLARWLGLKNDIDTMSQRQLVSLILWLLSRHEKKTRGMTLGW